MKRVLALCLLAAGLFACGEVVIKAPDFGSPTDPGTQTDESGPQDPGPTEDPGTPEDPGMPEDPGTPEDPGGEDPGPTDPGAEDPGETDIPLKDPQFAGAECRDWRECLSGGCNDGICACGDDSHCPDVNAWCDNDPAAFLGTNNCFAKRDIYAGCTAHHQCMTGACDTSAGFCVECAEGGTGCDEANGFFCCFGNCAQGCLGCPALPPPNPILTKCATACYDPATEYCTAAGAAPRQLGPAACGFQNQACVSGFCVPTEGGLSSECGCTDAATHCIGGWLCDTALSRCVPQAIE
jgi:hypothetical protein